jgi:hypothetical protein
MRAAKAPAADDLSAPPASQAVSQAPAFSFRLQQRVGRTLPAWTNKHRTSVTLASLVAGAPQQDAKDPRPGRLTRVWTFKDGRFEAVTVRVGLANDSWTELLEGPVRPGDQLVTQAAAK